MKSLKIPITRKNIDDGDFGETNTCAIAQAIDQFPGVEQDSIHVSEDEIKFETENGVSITYHTSKIPAIAKKFINRFDAIDEIVIEDESGEKDYDKTAEAQDKARAKLKPFILELPLPKWLLKLAK